MSARSLRPALMLIAAAAVAGAALWVALRPKPVPVDLVTVDHGPLVVTVDEEGYTRVRDLYVVSAPIAGHLLRIQRRAGDPVRAGETVLAEILPTAPAFNDRRTQAELQARARTAEAALSLARADVTRAKAQLAFARDEFSRADRLAAQGTVPQSTRDKAETEMRTRQAELDSARAQLKVRAFELETAKAALIEPGDDSAVANSDTCCVHIQAPVDGRVLRLIAESEQVVAAGQALLEVGDPRALEVVVELLSEDAVGVRPGARATIEDWGGPPLAATVRRIEPYGFTKVS
ncbi:MAG: HlyD family efflux transporter periplasmic adaptor subunit, partial [Rhodobacterales bacterium]|nr:HlyD family efflux transporter periplasmic adaptor subunit [Rhodobacterales bacterium]